MRRSRHAFAGIQVRWVIALIAVFLGFVVVFALIAAKRSGTNPLVALYFLIDSDTRYAPGYSSRAFDIIREGDSVTNVLAALGKPLRTASHEPLIAWVYSDMPVPGFERNGLVPGTHTYSMFRFSESGHVRGIVGQVGAVVEHGALSTRHTMQLGDGQNFLKLTRDQEEKLKGKSMAEIEVLYGKPAATNAQHAVKRLYYSDSPSGGNYRKRVIEIDRDGRVCGIDDGYYFD